MFIIDYKSYTLEEAEKLLGIKAKTLQRLIDEGKIRVMTARSGQKSIFGTELLRMQEERENQLLKLASEKIYTPKKAGQMLGVSTKTIRRWDEAGIIETLRTSGRQRRIPESEIIRIKERGSYSVVKNQPPRSFTDKLCTPKKAGEMLNMTRKTLKKWDEKGKIKVIWTPSGQRRIPESEILRILGERKEIERERNKRIIPNKHYRIREAGQILGVGETTLQHWSQTGKIKIFRTKGRLGGHRRILGSGIIQIRDEEKRKEEQGIKLYSRREASRLLGITEETLTRWAGKGKIKSEWVKDRWITKRFFPQSEILRIKAERNNKK